MMANNGRECKCREANRSDAQGARESRKFSKVEGVAGVRVGKIAWVFRMRHWGAVRGSNMAGIVSRGSEAEVPEGEVE
jgi:hypothetical protein